MTTILKPGDEVRILGKTVGVRLSDYYIGVNIDFKNTIQIIEYVEYEDGLVNLQFDGHPSVGFMIFAYDDIELVEPPFQIPEELFII